MTRGSRKSWQYFGLGLAWFFLLLWPLLGIRDGAFHFADALCDVLRIVADPFARENFHKMRYVTFMGAKWKISRVEVGYPRLILTIGGLYHE